jgi:hypothetical protein
MTLTEATPPQKQLCVACRTAVEPGATVCPTCKSWQARWKNTATYYGSYATALALILSGATYVGKNLYDLLHHIDDAEVLEFSQPGNAVYSNLGTSDVFLSHVESYWGDGANNSIQIGKQLSHGDIYYREETEEEKKEDQTFHHPFISNETGDGSTLLARPRCFAFRILSNDHFWIKQINKLYETMKQKLAMVNSESILFYYVGGSATPRRKIFSTIIAFVDLERPECR